MNRRERERDGGVNCGPIVGKEMGSGGAWLDTAKVHGAMLLVGAGYGGYFVLAKVSLSAGVDPFVFSTYRDGIGCISLVLSAAYHER